MLSNASEWQVQTDFDRCSTLLNTKNPPLQLLENESSHPKLSWPGKKDDDNPFSFFRRKRTTIYVLLARSLSFARNLSSWTGLLPKFFHSLDVQEVQPPNFSLDADRRRGLFTTTGRECNSSSPYYRGPTHSLTDCHHYSEARQREQIHKKREGGEGATLVCFMGPSPLS